MIDRSIPMTRVAFLLRYTALVDSLGAPLQHLLAESKIPEELLGHPEAGICLKSAFRFGELACEAAGTEHLGLYIGMNNHLRDLGPVGKRLKSSTTVYDYLSKGIELYNMLITGQRIWLSYHGKEIHLNVATIGETGIGSYQAQMETLATTTMALRRVMGRDWSPSKLCLSYRSGEAFPKDSCFAGSQIVKGDETSYMAIPRATLGLPFSSPGIASEQLPECIETHRFSNDLSDMVHMQIEAMLCEEKLHIDTVAESLAMTRRTLQRLLAEQGTSYSNLLADTQAHKAMECLQNFDQPISDIAYDLGYTDASNFTRAFRLRNGVSPQQFRQNLNPHL